MLDINPGLIVWTIFTFLVLLFILRKFAWKPIVGALNDREARIHDALKSAETAREEAQRLIAQNRDMMAKAEEESRKLFNESRALGEKLKDEIVDKANQQARKMVDSAKEEISRDKDAALNQLRNEVASMAVEAAGKILNESLDPARHRKLIDDVLNKMPKN
ncbi:MAG TPA: F0F1 ATP synthase subunit B [Bacteroidota bacterium]|nr:F0F1 ATP synthase subunit B [Bacteroidota bacterium]